MHAVVVKEHVFQSVHVLLFHFKRVFRLVLDFAVHDVENLPSFRVQRVWNGIIHKPAPCIVDTHGSPNHCHMGGLDHATVSRDSRRQRDLTQFSSLQEVVSPQVEPVGDKKEWSQTARFCENDPRLPASNLAYAFGVASIVYPEYFVSEAHEGVLCLVVLS